VRFKLPVPQTDSGSQVENTKEIERIVVKELGKMAVTSGEGAPEACMDLLQKRCMAAETSE